MFIKQGKTYPIIGQPVNITISVPNSIYVLSINTTTLNIRKQLREGIFYNLNFTRQNENEMTDTHVCII